jgi:hypothetical protein
MPHFDLIANLYVIGWVRSTGCGQSVGRTFRFKLDAAEAPAGRSRTTRKLRTEGRHGCGLGPALAVSVGLCQRRCGAGWEVQHSHSWRRAARGSTREARRAATPAQVVRRTRLMVLWGHPTVRLGPGAMGDALRSAGLVLRAQAKSRLAKASIVPGVLCCAAQAFPSVWLHLLHRS